MGATSLIGQTLLPDGTNSGFQVGKNKVKFFIPAGTQSVGDYHTHGNYSDERCRPTSPDKDVNDSDGFSDGDIEDGYWKSKKKPGWTKYLGTPGGNFYEYQPPFKPRPLMP
jgi:hypothetical protein